MFSFFYNRIGITKQKHTFLNIYTGPRLMLRADNIARILKQSMVRQVNSKIYASWETTIV